jgi:Caspase domain
MNLGRRTDTELSVREVAGAVAARTRPRPVRRASALAAAGLIAVAAGSWPRGAVAHVAPELMAPVVKAAEGGAAGDAAARAASAAGTAETGGVARFALIVGVNRGIDPELAQLHFADDDAARYSDLFRALGARVHLLTRPDENTLRISSSSVSDARLPVRDELARAVSELAREVTTARARGRRVVFYFVYAGHGNIRDNTVYLALEDQRLDADEIERHIVDRVHADESHLIVDACYSYFLAYGRGPSGIRRPVGLFSAHEGLARRADVGLLLSTTSARESHEWTNFEAGIFSHEVRSGLSGAADLDGDGQVSYLEIAAFVMQANAAVPNERFRPRIFTHAPATGSQLVDLRNGVGRRLKIETSAYAEHCLLENLFGVRLADFNSQPGHPISLLMPISAQALYLRRASDGRQLAIPDSAEVVSLGAMGPPTVSLEPRGPGGPAEYAFEQLFLLPLDQEALANYARHPADADPEMSPIEVAVPLQPGARRRVTARWAARLPQR